MKRRHLLTSMGAFTASGSLVVGSSGFSTSRANRAGTVDVVGDEDAYLGLLYEDVTVEEPPDSVDPATLRAIYEETLVELLNRFDRVISVDDFEIEVESDDGVDAELGDVPETLDVGESGAVPIEVECSTIRLETETATVSFDVAVSGAGLSGETTESRTVEVECLETTDSVVESLDFRGSGNVHLSLGEGIQTVTLDIWMIDNDDRSLFLVEDEIVTDVGDNTTLQPKSISSQQDSFAAVYVSEADTTYVHPGLERTNGEWRVTGSGSGVQRDGALSRDDLIDFVASL